MPKKKEKNEVEIEVAEIQKLKEDEEKADELFKEDVEVLKNKEDVCLENYKIPTEYIKSVANGFNNAFIFLGSQGLGKSYLTRQVLAKSNTKFLESRGVSSPLALYQFIYNNNRKDLTLVFDDVAGLVNNPNAFSILLGILWGGCASWNSTTEKLKVPKKFVFEGKIIIIANKLDGDNADVIKSRCLTYDLEMSREDKLSMMYFIAKQKHNKLSKEERIKVVDFIKDNTDNQSEFDLRTQFKAEQLYLYDRENWKELSLSLIKNTIKDMVEMCMYECYSVSQAERRFCNETGLSRNTFYKYKRKI